ncbi:MAG TPA: S8 family peptidase [Bacillota bacterium]
MFQKLNIRSMGKSGKDWTQKLSTRLINPEFSGRPEKPLRVIIEHSGRKTDRITSLIENNQGKVNREIGLFPGLAVELPYSVLEELAHSRHVHKIWHDAPVRILLDVAVPTVGGTQVQQAGFTGTGVNVAVLDTGIYPHPDLVTPSNRILAWNDLVNHKENPYDDNGHGTHVAGIIAGNGYKSDGKYTGMAPETRLIGIKVLDQDGEGVISTIISGIEWCINNFATLKLRAINLSMGSAAQESYRSDPLCRAATAAWRKGIVVCCAGGNEGPDSGTIDSPGINPKTITVGNLDDQQTLSPSDDRLSDTSSRGPTIDRLMKPDILAPGTNITSTWKNGGYRSLSGTSMSTPVVTGAVAQIVQKWPKLKPDQIKRQLLKNARDIGLGTNLQGAGVLDLERIFKLTPNKAQSGAGFEADHLRQVCAYQIMTSLMDKAGKEKEPFLRKRDSSIQNALLSFMSKWFG